MTAAPPNTSLVLHQRLRRYGLAQRWENDVRRFSSILALGLLALMVFAAPASAGVSWCRSDPIVRIQGYTAQILVGVPAQYVSLVDGPIDVRIDIPSTFSREVVMTDAGFNGYGERVRWGTSYNQVRLVVTVPIDESRLGPGEIVPVEVTINTPFGNGVIYGDSTQTTLSVPLN
jgi:hypothetical protein